MTFTEFKEKYNLRLSAQQEEAVKSINGPVLLLAVPGSGKTTVLVSRLGYMIIANNIPAKDILVLTYTTSATSDMTERFEQFFGKEYSENLEFRTINGVCQKIYGYCAYIFKQQPYELIDDNTQLISNIIREITEEFPSEIDIKNMKQAIGYIKNMMLSDAEISRHFSEYEIPVLDIYKAYNAALKARSLMDYDDQMVYAHLFLTRFPEVLKRFQGLYKYICVDEAQDTSKIQHEIIKLLAADNENLFMVGDEDQSIYGFRAAYPDALLNFESDHPGAKVLLMEDNYRSTGNIVSLADSFIQKNISRHKKSIKATRPLGKEVKEIELTSRGAQYSYLLKVAGSTTSQTAILYRENESALPLIDQFERNNIAYRLIGASKEFVFFSHRTVLDIRNIIHFAEDIYDVELFKQIYYKINTYIKKDDALKICALSQSKGISIPDAAIEIATSSRNSGLVKAFRELKENCKAVMKSNASMALSNIIYEMGYGAYLKRAKIGESKLFILREIAINEKNAVSFLQRLDELSKIVKEKPTDYSAKILLSTFHSSKGLEYDNVYLIDVIDGEFPEKYVEPKKMAKLRGDELKSYEEERRLFYVAITRARNYLSLFSLPQSSFVRELFGKETSSKASMRSKEKKEVTPAPTLLYGKSKQVFDQKAYVEYCKDLYVGKIVKHKTFGKGVIAAIDGIYISISFSKGLRTLSSKILFEKDLLE